MTSKKDVEYIVNRLLKIALRNNKHIDGDAKMLEQFLSLLVQNDIMKLDKDKVLNVLVELILSINKDIKV